jgi:hypothetical protein
MAKSINTKEIVRRFKGQKNALDCVCEDIERTYDTKNAMNLNRCAAAVVFLLAKLLFDLPSIKSS